MDTYKDLMEKIRTYDSIMIFGHGSPDGDCYGAQSGLKVFLKEVFPEKKVAVLGSGFLKAIPVFGGPDTVSDEEIASSLAVLVDCSDIERVEDQRITEAREIVKIDHHLGSEKAGVAAVNVSDTSASSACQMVGQLILDNGYPISKEVGERLFMGIVTDTGRFQYLTSCRGLFEVTAEILKAGIDFQKIYDFLYEGDEISTRAKGYISCNFKADGPVAYIVMDRNTLKEMNVEADYASTMVNCMSSMKEFPIWVSFAERENGEIRTELRSRCYNVQPVALMFGGGGHARASGCILHDLKRCREVIESLKGLVQGEK